MCNTLLSEKIRAPQLHEYFFFIVTVLPSFRNLSGGSSILLLPFALEIMGRSSELIEPLRHRTHLYRPRRDKTRFVTKFKVRLKPTCSATETWYNIANNICADRTPRMHKLIRTFDVRMQHCRGARGPYYTVSKNH